MMDDTRITRIPFGDTRNTRITLFPQSKNYNPRATKGNPAGHRGLGFGFYPYFRVIFPESV